MTTNNWKAEKKIELKIHRITRCWKRQISGVRYLSIHWVLSVYGVYEISIETAQVKSDMISVVMWKCIKSKPSFPFALPHSYVTACEPTSCRPRTEIEWKTATKIFDKCKINLNYWKTSNYYLLWTHNAEAILWRRRKKKDRLAPK